jgi:predicted MFS family arabinose efflux permease
MVRCQNPDVTAPADTSFRWDRMTVACVLSFCVLVCGLGVGVVLGELREQLGLSGLVAAAHGSTYGVGLLVAACFGLSIVHRIGRTRTYWGSCATVVVGVLLLCVGQSWPVTLLGTAISGVSCAMLVMLMPGIVSDHHGSGMAGAFAAINGVPGLAAVVFSIVIGASLALGLSWRWPYALVTLGFAGATFVAARGAPLPSGEPARPDVRALFARRDVRRPLFDIVHAILVEFPIGVWAIVYLKEVGGASSGLAAALGAVWGVAMMGSRLAVPAMTRHLGAWTRSVGFGVAAVGSTMLWLGPGLWPRVFWLLVVGVGVGPLYPLTVEQMYRRTAADSVSLGAVAALGAAVAIMTGPLLVGVLDDRIGLRGAILFVPVLAAIGVFTARPRATLVAESAEIPTNLQPELVSDAADDVRS